MSAVLESACLCECIGAPLAIRFCAEHHRYHFGDKQLVSVTQVIRTLYPTDYSMVDPAVLEKARIRGVLVDRYFCEYLKSGRVDVPQEEREDVKERLKILIPWWDNSGFEIYDVQQIVFSKNDGVAGTLDIAVITKQGKCGVLDLKAVSSLQKSYQLQLGAYLSYSGADEAGIVHVTKDKCRLVHYDAETCKRQWRAIVTAYNVIQELNGQ